MIKDSDNNTTSTICTCENPNGFTFLKYEDDHQVWTHVKCGGLVIRILIRE